MNGTNWSEVFFFISSIGFISLWVLTIVFLFYLIKTMHTFSRIMNKLEKDIENISEGAKDMIDDVRDNMIFKFLFGKKKKHHKVKK